MIAEVVYTSRDNAIDLQLVADGRVVNLADVTKMELVDDSLTTTISSETSPAAFDWSAGNGIVSLSLGGLTPPLSAATRSIIFSLIVYDPSNLQGIVWGQIKVSVKRV